MAICVAISIYVSCLAAAQAGQAPFASPAQQVTFGPIDSSQSGPYGAGTWLWPPNHVTGLRSLTQVLFATRELGERPILAISLALTRICRSPECCCFGLQPFRSSKKGGALVTTHI